MANILSSESGRRGNWRWRYGTHGWVPEQQFDFSRGFIQDVAQTDLPPGSLWDVTDFLVHFEGALVKRGPTAYAGPAMTSATNAASVAYAEYPAGSKLIAVGDNGHIYSITSGTTTDLGGSTVTTVDNPKFRIGGSKNLLVFPASDGTSVPVVYDGSAAPTNLGGTPPAGKFCAVYKSRLALGAASATPQRVYFSPTPDITSTWDTTNAWIDFDHPITGLCALQNALLVFSAGHTERLIGSTPPPGSDMDRQPVGDIGCLDARSIAVWENNAVFASSRGVFMTNGSTFVNLTGGVHGNDGILRYWNNSLMPNYTAGSTAISAGIYQDFYILTLQNQISLMCHIPTRAWTKLVLNIPVAYSSQVGSADELYYADGGTNRVVKMSGIFASPGTNSSNTGVDADGTPIEPSFQTKSYGSGSSNVAVGDVHLTMLLQETTPSSSPTMIATYNPNPYGSMSGVGGVALGNSPIAATSHSAPKMDRYRLGVGVDTAAISFTFQQTAQSSSTTIRGVEVDMRPYPNPAEGPTT